MLDENGVSFPNQNVAHSKEIDTNEHTDEEEYNIPFSMIAKRKLFHNSKDDIPEEYSDNSTSDPTFKFKETDVHSSDS